MTLTWTIIFSWLALQVPLATLIGKCIRFGMVEPMIASGDLLETAPRF